MTKMLDSVQTRRALLRSALVVAGGAVVSACARTIDAPTLAARPAPPLPVPEPRPFIPATVATQSSAPAGIRPELFHRAVAALNRHSMSVRSHDKIAIADFASSSSNARFHIVNLGSGECTSLLVAHGSGSDPAHTGFLQRFSNVPGSNATSEGAYLTSNYYYGKHGRSQRLLGLDATNSNALDRAIVVHGAWYANADMLETHGKLGRSQGCFAVGEGNLDLVFGHLGEGRMIYAAKI